MKTPHGFLYIPPPPATHHPQPHLNVNHLSDWILTAGHQLTKAYHYQQPQTQAPRQNGWVGGRWGGIYQESVWSFHQTLVCKITVVGQSPGHLSPFDPLPVEACVATIGA